MLRFLLSLLVCILTMNCANAFMLGSDVADMVTAPFSMHRTSGNEVMPKFMQRASDLFSEDSEDVDIAPYVKKLQQKVKSNFNPPAFEGTPTTVVLFKVSKNGRLESFKIIKSSNDELFDHAAVRAIQMSAPFDKFPDGFEKDILKIQFTFSKNTTSVNYF